MKGRPSPLRLSLIIQTRVLTFDVDLQEIIHLFVIIQLVRDVQKYAVAMFAMRACRKSVMIGMPLSN
jgi:DNA mismatch repair ATPase MutL